MTATDTAATSPRARPVRGRDERRDAASSGAAAGHTEAAEQAVQATSSSLHLSLGQTRVDITLPPVEKLAFYAGLSGAVAFGLIEWPIAVLTGVGHLLSDDRGNRALRALGEALDAA